MKLIMIVLLVLSTLFGIAGMTPAHSHPSCHTHNSQTHCH
jgi:hypothetical protein